MAEQSVKIIDPHINDRLTGLEKDTSQIAAFLDQLRQQQEADRQRAEERYDRLVQATDVRTKNIYTRIEQDRKMPWAGLAIATTLVIAVVSAWGSLYGRDLNRLEQGQEKLVNQVADRIRAAEYQRGRTDEHRERNEDDIESLRDWNVKQSELLLKITERLSVLEERTGGSNR